MTAGRRHLERLPGPALPADVGQVGRDGGVGWRTGRVVLAATGDHPLTVDELDDLLVWAGGHAAELGARPDDVLVTASGHGAAVSELRRRVKVDGWPRLAVLDEPDS